MRTTKWLLITAIFAAIIFVLLSQQGHAYIKNTWFFINKTWLVVVAIVGLVYSIFKLIKSRR